MAVKNISAARFAQGAAEIRRSGGLVTQQAELGLHERMVDDDETSAWEEKQKSKMKDAKVRR